MIFVGCGRLGCRASKHHTPTTVCTCFLYDMRCFEMKEGRRRITTGKTGPGSGCCSVQCCVPASLSPGTFAYKETPAGAPPHTAQKHPKSCFVRAGWFCSQPLPCSRLCGPPPAPFSHPPHAGNRGGAKPEPLTESTRTLLCLRLPLRSYCYAALNRYRTHTHTRT